MESLNIQLQPLFDWLLRTTLQASLVICLILLLQTVLRSRLGVRWHYCLWLVLLVRMAMPWAPESRVSLFNLLPQTMPQRQFEHANVQVDHKNADPIAASAHTDDSPPISTTKVAQAESEATTVTAQPRKEAEGPAKSTFPKFVAMLPLAWLAGALVLAIYVCASSLNFLRIVRLRRPVTDQKILDLLEDCKSLIGIRTILGVVATDKVKCPALFGFVRPRLLLPEGMIEALSEQELRYVFLHELAHLKRHDIYVGWLVTLLQILHWFNPLVWLAFYRMRSDRELACDALVMARTQSDEPKSYGRIIVNLVERFSRPQRLPSMAGILETKSQLKRRIKMIADYKKTSRTRWAGAMLLFAVLACVVLTNAYVAKADFTFGTATNLGPTVNSWARDAQPSISADGLELYFGSDRSEGYGNYDLWVTTRGTKDDEWGSPMNLGPTVNTSGLDRCPSISADGLSLFFESKRAGGAGGEDVWVATRAMKDEPWGTPVNLGPTVNSWTSEGCPNISADGLSLFFRAGRRLPGFGGQDLQVTTRATSDDDWGPPVNLGATVNTAFTDNGASISANGLTLFFDSDRSGGYGERDLYVTMRATTSDPWSMPVNLGPTVNSSSGEGAPSISDDGSTLFFSSRRPGGLGDADLWQVAIEPIVDLNSDGIVDSADICIIIDHWGTDQPLCDVGPMPWGDGIVDVQDLIVLAEHLFEEFPPIALWNMDETQGSIAYDSIDENDGTLNGGPLWQPGGGKVGGSLRLDGVDDYVATPFILDPAKGSFSIFAWIKGGGQEQVIISQKDITEGRTTNPGSAWLLAGGRHGKLVTRLTHPPFDPLVSESVIADGQWHHVGLVYDFEGLHRHLYVDGAEVAKDSDVVGGVGSNGSLYFGVGPALQTGTFWSGLIDDIRIYDEVLSAEEVAELKDILEQKAEG